jgi:phosphoglycerate dehydrogenase-like enzyme
MNASLTIVSTYTFSDRSLALFKQAAPQAAVHQSTWKEYTEVPADLLARADVYYATGEPPTRDAAPNLKWVAWNYAGVESIVNAPIFKTGEVTLTTAAGVHAVNMGEYTLMMMLALAHKMRLMFKMMNGKTWHTGASSEFMPMELHGATLGLIGYGALGRRIAELARAFGMQVMALRYRLPTPQGERRSGGAGVNSVRFVLRSQLGALLQQSDFIVLAVPITPDTRHMIDARALAQMKSTAFLINIGRGAVVDESALVEALHQRRIAGAALDVFEREPLPDDSPLWQLAETHNVILSPHMAGQTPNYEARAAALFAENLRRFVAGEPLLNQVDFARGY